MSDWLPCGLLVVVYFCGVLNALFELLLSDWCLRGECLCIVWFMLVRFSMWVFEEGVGVVIDMFWGVVICVRDVRCLRVCVSGWGMCILVVWVVFSFVFLFWQVGLLWRCWVYLAFSLRFVVWSTWIVVWLPIGGVLCRMALVGCVVWAAVDRYDWGFRLLVCDWFCAVEFAYVVWLLCSW